METSKKLLIGSASASAVCIILNVLGVLSVEVTLAVIGFATAIGMFYLWKAKMKIEVNTQSSTLRACRKHIRQRKRHVFWRSC